MDILKLYRENLILEDKMHANISINNFTSFIVFCTLKNVFIVGIPLTLYSRQTMVLLVFSALGSIQLKSITDFTNRSALPARTIYQGWELVSVLPSSR